MEAPDTRGAGGRAPRSRGVPTPGKFIGLVASPLQLISKTVKGLVGSSPNDNHNRAGAATQRPSPPVQHRQSRPESLPKPKVDEGPNGFSFPTLAGSNDSPPTNSLSRPVPPAPSPQPCTLGVTDVSAQPAQPCPAGGSKEALLNGWSPSKLASLNFFMNGAKSGADVVRSTTAGPAAGPGLSDILRTPEPARPYFNLTAMLRAGPGGLVSGASGIPGDDGAAAKSISGAGALLPSGASRGARYNPYGRPNAPKPPRPSAAPAPSSAAGALGGASVAGVPSETSQRQPAAEPPRPALAAAAAHLPPPNPRVAPAPSGVAPRAPTAPGAVRLAPGQVAFASGRTGTPLPKFGPLATAGQGQQQLMAQTPGGFRPLAGAAGAKRQRESIVASPLMASGARNLSEFKRRRQTVPQQPRCVLAGLSVRTPRENTPARCDGDRTPGAVGSAGSGGAVTPLPPSGGVSTAEMPATETARKILETLDNFKRSGDANTPSVLSTKPAASVPRTGPATGSPLPGPFMPPLDRLDQNHYGGAPTPSITTGAPGFVCGATPSPSGNAINGGQTPGPRMVLEFKTPVASPAFPSTRQADSTSVIQAASTEQGNNKALPLSPITVPQVAPATERHASTGIALVSSAAGEAPGWSMPCARNRTDAVAAGPSPAAGSGVATLDSVSTSSVPQFSFCSARAPIDAQLRRAKEVCDADAAAASALPASATPEVFIFGPAALGVDTLATKNRMEAPSSAADTSLRDHASEVRKAAAMPLPDDDEDEAEAVVATAITPVAASAPASDARPLGLASKSVPSGNTKRVAFAEQPEAAQPEKQQDAFVPRKDVPPVATSTPPATPGGFFFSSDAGSTPFHPFGGDVSPAAALGEKTSVSADKQDESDRSRPSLFSFGTPIVASAAASAEASKPAVTSSFGQTSTTSSFTFGALPKQFALIRTSDTTVTDAAAADRSIPEKSLTDAGRMEALTQAKSSSAALEAPSKEPTPALTSVYFSAPAASAPTLPFTFGAPTSAVGASSAMGTSAVAAAVATGMPTQTSLTPAAGVVQAFGASSAPAASWEPVVSVAGSSTPAPVFGVAPACASAAAPAVGFAFNAASSSTAASSSVAPSAPPAAAAASSFGAASTGIGLALAPAFGSPMPVSSASTAPMFGASQPSSAPVGLGSGGFGAASGPATSFTFGGQANSGSSGATGTVSGVGFGVQQGTSNPAPTFAFGGAASAPSFGGSAAAPSFGASATAPQTTFGTTMPAFGGSANPFATAAPSFAASASQPSFGGATAAAAPAFGSAPPAAAAPSFSGFGGSNGGAPATGMFAFGASASAPFTAAQPAPAAAPAFGQAAPTFGMGGQPAQASAPGMGGFAPPAPFGAPQPFGGVQGAPAGDAGSGFSLGVGDPREGRKRVKARRHG